jgi:hypothetical protein
MDTWQAMDEERSALADALATFPPRRQEADRSIMMATTTFALLDPLRLASGGHR